MNKFLITISLLWGTSIFANINDVIISENYIPQKDCKIVSTIKVNDSSELSKEDIYKQLKIKADKLGANVVLSTTYHAGIFTNYISGDAAICDLELTPSVKSKQVEMNSKEKFSKSMYKYPMISELFTKSGIEMGYTSSMNGTVFGGLSYGTKNDYELYGHIIYLQDKKSKARDLGYIIGLRHYLFANSKYKSIRLTLSYGTQYFEYINKEIVQENGANLGLGYVWTKSSGLSFDMFYKAIDSSKNVGKRNHLNFIVGYKF